MTTSPLSNDDNDGFTSITYKKPPRPSKNRKGKNRYRERSLSEKLEQRKNNLTSSGYLRECIELLRNSISPPSQPSASTSRCPYPTRVVCLGLGSINDSTKAQDQYILLQELVKELVESANLSKDEPVQFYDPVFSPEDTTFLTSQGHLVLSSDFPLHLTTPTFLYIPHGPRHLFNELLSSNWTSNRLNNVIVFGNRLDLYDDPTYSGTTSQSKSEEKDQEGKGELKGGKEWISKAAPLFEIVPLPSTKEHLEAFNDLALEWVNLEGLDRAVEEGRIPLRDDHPEEERVNEGEEEEKKVETINDDAEVREDEGKRSVDEDEQGALRALDKLSLSSS